MSLPSDDIHDDINVIITASDNDKKRVFGEERRLRET